MEKNNLLMFFAVVALFALSLSARTPLVDSPGHIRMLERLGIHMDSLYWMGDTVTLEDFGYYPINDEKPALLGKVWGFGEFEDPDIEADMGIYSIAGVKQYETVMALVLYSVEHGDGSHQELAAYHPRGELVDHINMGYWHDWSGFNIDDDPPSDISIITNSFLTFTDDGFDLHAIDEVYDIDDHERLAENRKGRAVKVVHYAYNGMDGFKLLGIDFDHEGLFFADHYAHDDIRDLRYWPLSDTNVFDRINELAAQHAATREVPDDLFDDVDDALQTIVSQRLGSSAKPFMQWLYWHRNDENNHLKPIVIMNFVSGLDDYEAVLSVLNPPDLAKVREYASHLLDGWLENNPQ